MKGLIKIVAALAAFAGVASCSKDVDSGNWQNEGQETSVVEITASFGTTKVSYTETDGYGLHPAWEVGDPVIGIYGDNYTCTFTVKKVEDSGRAILSSSDAPTDGPIHLIYKSGISASDWQSGSMQVSYGGQDGTKTMPAIMFSEGTIKKGIGTFIFYNAGAVIGIDHAKGVAAGASITKVTIKGTNLSAATVTVDGTLKLTAATIANDVVTTSALSGFAVGSGADRKLNTPIFIAVPAGAEIKSVELTAGSTYTGKLSSAKSVNSNKYLHTRDLSFQKEPAKFSVAAGKQVEIATGNLYCKKESNGTYSFHIEENPWDYRWADISNLTPTDAATWEGTSYDHDPCVIRESNTSGLFQWIPAHCVGDNNGASGDVAEARKSLGAFSRISNDNLASSTPETVNFSQAIDGWRILSRSEWEYLLFNRGTVLPDLPGYLWGEINTSRGKIYGILIFYDGMKYNDIIGKTALDLIADGCAFLPVTSRHDTERLFLRNSNYDGWYWSSSCDTNSKWETTDARSAWQLYFWGGDSKENGLCGIGRSAGLSVRLVRDIE